MNERENEFESNEFVYCGIRKCPHTVCLRHNKNTPVGKIVVRKNFTPNAEWNCKDKVL